MLISSPRILFLLTLTEASCLFYMLINIKMMRKKEEEDANSIVRWTYFGEILYYKWQVNVIAYKCNSITTRVRLQRLHHIRVNSKSMVFFVVWCNESYFDLHFDISKSNEQRKPTTFIHTLPCKSLETKLYRILSRSIPSCYNRCTIREVTIFREKI